MIFRPGICKNIFLCSVLHWRIIRIKRFFSGVHACVHGADALINWISARGFIELWTDQKRKSSSSYEQIKNKQVTVLLSNQKAPKRYTLIL
jgi:hypothetical protein